jgi:photosystem II stability/assembly factor-like uncharacterized protein
MKKIIYSLVIIISALSCIKLYSQQGWIPQQTGFTFNITSVHFLNGMYGMAVSSTGEMIKTTNGGVNWTALNPGMTVYFADVRIVDSNITCAAGTSSANSLPAIIRTSNAGMNWSVVWTGTNGNYTFNNMIFFHDSGAVCLNTTLFGGAQALKTNNGGLNWSSVAAGGGIGTPQHFCFVSTRIYWHLSYYEYFVSTYPPHYEYDQFSIRTTDGGSGFSGTEYESNLWTNYGARIYLFKNIPYTNIIGFAVKSTGTWMKSEDNGNSWNSSVSTPASCFASNVFIVNALKIYFIGLKNSAYYVIGKSTNGGMNWAIQMTPQNYVLNKIYFLNENTGWIGSNSGIILKTTDGGVTPVIPVSEKVPSSFSLSQNYPNPFNPSTLIRINVGKTENGKQKTVVKLVVYDVAGKEVARLVNKELQPGTYEVTFNGSGLNSGVYFYRLSAGDFTETKRMILVK